MPNLDLPEPIAFRYDALYQWLSRRYDLQLTRQRIAGLEIPCFTVSNIDMVLDDIIMESTNPDDRSPYWSELWPSALALSRFIIEEGGMKGRRAIELGCGLGLPSIVAARCGARVILSDYEEDALRIAELNWIHNFQTLPETLYLDWFAPALDGKLPLILASDVAYEKRLFEPLVRTFGALLEPGGQIWLSEPGRPVARDFFDLMREAGFFWSSREISVMEADSEMVASVHCFVLGSQEAADSAHFS